MQIPSFCKPPLNRRAYYTETLRIMRLTAILLLAACLHVTARGYTQDKITLHEKDAPLTKVLTEIQSQTKFYFIFPDKLMLLSKKVTISVKDVSLDEALQLCFKNQPLIYSIVSNEIIIRLKNVEERPTVRELLGREVSGKIADEDGSAISGATIIVKGSNQAISADSKGQFILKNLAPTAILVISCVGYETQEVSLNGKNELVISLKKKNGQLDEMQIIAYGTTTERYSVGNINKVSSQQISQQPISNPLQALEGEVPGLFITQSNGISGGGITVRIQGQNSIQNGNDPLYVVDGVPYISQMPATVLGGVGILGTSGGSTLSGINGNSANGNPMSYLNPSDIENIEVLKDADATAIYGSRAANGAILITTKKGKAGLSRVDINVQSGWGNDIRKLDLLNTPAYLEMRHEAKSNDNAAITSTDYDINGVWDTTRNTNWQKTLLGGTAQYTNLNASVSGGTVNSTYLIGGTYHKETTVFPGNFADQKGSVHFNLGGSSPNQKFKITGTANFTFDDNQLPNADFTSYATTLAPDAPKLFNQDGSINWQPNTAGTATWTNPLFLLYKLYQTKTTNLISNSILSYTIIPGLEVKSSFGYTNMQINEFLATPLTSVPIQSQVYGSAERFASYSYNNANSWIAEPQVNYTKELFNGKLDGLVGGTFLQNNETGQDLSGQGYNSDAVLQDIHSAAIVNVTASTASVYKYSAAFARINYNWQNTLIIDLTARRDGSSRFGQSSQFHNFGSAGGAWIFTQSKFFKDKFRFLDFGKLRGSYGTTGNDQIGDYQFMSLYTPLSATVPYQGISSLTPAGLPNAYLQWEETKKMQFGLDLGLFKDRIVLTANYANNRSSDQLLQYLLPSITGFTNVLENFPATVQNTDWEFVLRTSNIKTKKFTWTSDLNLTIPENKLVAFPNLSTSTYAGSLIVGKPLGSIKAYHFDGVNPQTGEYQFLDYKGNTTSTPNYLTDRTVLININPRIYGGFRNTFSYNGIQLDFLFQFVKQRAINSDYFGLNQLPGYKLLNQPVSVLNRWQAPGDNTTIQRYNSNRSLFTQYSDVKSSDAGFSDASYIRLKNLSLSYELPSSWKRKASLQNCRIYVQGQNLFTITKYHGLDPETQSLTSLPPLRVITVGFQVGL